MDDQLTRPNQPCGNCGEWRYINRTFMGGKCRIGCFLCNWVINQRDCGTCRYASDASDRCRARRAALARGAHE
jgi:hypothetical protein